MSSGWREGEVAGFLLSHAMPLETEGSVVFIASEDGNTVMSTVGTVEKAVLRVKMKVGNRIFSLKSCFKRADSLNQNRFTGKFVDQYF